jgi:hypothetical protein
MAFVTAKNTTTMKYAIAKLQESADEVADPWVGPFDNVTTT